ncbi:MAG TPA: chemotaxis protein CheX [Spirochaetota bacterium]|jgi:chemotaxis protein CheX|nr:chemotaxis protein CheX [Spirochaetota bacterium]HOH36720.1 chemotaxis protein CheX [Spirochaetota bacterium]HPJ15379.1 chemotaxis protein CheX [Spirochaetota bacterium]HPM34568.1 chemotaxis protein CheX [Spirochaetota bacterium]HPY02340.1 chemotaxis protein CheX [Spirochaetota bacterium]
MTELEIKGFIKVLTDYFLSVTGSPANMGVPFIKENNTEVFDYVAVIGISGSRKGGVYFTANRPLLEEIARHILGETGLDDATLYDLIGEMTNTISGNMRELFGSTFLISVPIILKGNIDEVVLRLKPPVYVIPIEWNGHKSHLAIGLE